MSDEKDIDLNKYLAEMTISSPRFDFETPNINNFLPKIDLRNYDLADYMCERLIKSINEFERGLPPDMQAGGKLVCFQNITFSIDDIKYWNPNMIKFCGTLPTGEKVCECQ